MDKLLDSGRDRWLGSQKEGAHTHELYKTFEFVEDEHRTHLTRIMAALAEYCNILYYMYVILEAYKAYVACSLVTYHSGHSHRPTSRQLLFIQHLYTTAIDHFTSFPDNMYNAEYLLWRDKKDIIGPTSFQPRRITSCLSGHGICLTGIGSEWRLLCGLTG